MSDIKRLYLRRLFKSEARASKSESSRFAAVVDADLCTACEECVDRCYFDAIEVTDFAQITEEKCMGCGLCLMTCPVEAISLKEIREEAFVPE